MSKFNNRTDVYDKRKLTKLDLKDLRDVNWTRLSGKACQRDSDVSDFEHVLLAFYHLDALFLSADSSTGMK